MKKTSYLYNLYQVKELVLISAFLISLGIFNKNKVLIILGLTGLLFLFFFFRNSYNHKSINNNNFISPSSSKIKSVKSSQKGYIVKTYLSFLEKHFMIAPVDCEIVNIERAAINKNDAERLKVTFKDNKGNIFRLDQIVSKIGRGAWLIKLFYKYRCILFNKVGDKLKQGERYGLIRFGSNMEYYIPKSYKITVKKDDKCKLGSTIAKSRLINFNYD